MVDASRHRCAQYSVSCHWISCLPCMSSVPGSTPHFLLPEGSLPWESAFFWGFTRQTTRSPGLRTKMTVAVFKSKVTGTLFGANGNELFRGCFGGTHIDLRVIQLEFDASRRGIYRRYGRRNGMTGQEGQGCWFGIRYLIMKNISSRLIINEVFLATVHLRLL